jgi:hypothetical protein
MKIAVISCSQEAVAENTLLVKSLDNIKKYVNVVPEYVRVFTSNKEGLSTCYNRALNEDTESDIMVFVHDDVSIDDGLFIPKLIEAHKTYDIVGIAGGLNPLIKAPALWHLMCGGFGSNLRGAAGHYLDDTLTAITNFGYAPARVAILDGVFLSVKIDSIRRTGWKFNENYKFHHYDIASCLDANSLKLKLGVANIHINHKSPGLRSLDDKSFLESQSIFLNEYKTY